MRHRQTATHFEAGFASMTQGFNGAWDQLAGYLASLKA